MTNCEECNNKLGILEGYHHPALGKKFFVCNECFSKVDERMQRWSKFCLSDSFNAESQKIDIEDAWNNSMQNDLPLQKWFSSLWIKIDCQNVLNKI
jgi:hypothetical protein